MLRICRISTCSSDKKKDSLILRDSSAIFSYEIGKKLSFLNARKCVWKVEKYVDEKKCKTYKYKKCSLIIFKQKRDQTRKGQTRREDAKTKRNVSLCHFMRKMTLNN